MFLQPWLKQPHFALAEATSTIPFEARLTGFTIALASLDNPAPMRSSMLLAAYPLILSVVGAGLGLIPF